MVKEEDKIEMDGVVVEALPGTQFTVKLENAQIQFHAVHLVC